MRLMASGWMYACLGQEHDSGDPRSTWLSSTFISRRLRRSTRAAVHCALSESIDMDAVVHMAGRGHRGRWLSAAGSAGKGLCFACKRRTAAAATARANAILEATSVDGYMRAPKKGTSLPGPLGCVSDRPDVPLTRPKHVLGSGMRPRPPRATWI